MVVVYAGRFLVQSLPTTKKRPAPSLLIMMFVRQAVRCALCMSTEQRPSLVPKTTYTFTAAAGGSVRYSAHWSQFSGFHHNIVFATPPPLDRHVRAIMLN